MSALFCAALTVAMGIMVLVGWRIDSVSLKQIGPQFVAMNPVTAVTFIASGAGLLCLAFSSRSRGVLCLSRVCAAGVAATGAARLIAYYFGWNDSIDRLLFTEQLNVGPFAPNRMAPNTAVLFLMTGAAMLLHGSRQSFPRVAGQGLALMELLFSFLALAGYAVGSRSHYGITFFIPMAVHTALGFALMGMGILLYGWSSRSFFDRVADKARFGSADADVSLQRRIAAGFTGALFFLCVVSVASFISMKKYLADAERDERSRQALIHIGELNSAVLDIETGVRGFVLSGDRSYLAPYHAATEEMPLILGQLAGMLQDHPQQHEAFTLLRMVVERRIEKAKQTVRLMEEAGPEAARSAVKSGKGKALMDQIRMRVEEMMRLEEELLATRSAGAAASARATMLIVGLGSPAAFFVVAVASYIIRRDILARRRAEAALKKSESQLRAILDLAMDWIVVTDDAQRIVAVNPATLTTFGLNEVALIDRPFQEVLLALPSRTLDLSELADRRPDAVEGTAVERVEAVAVRADGTEFPVELAVAKMAEMGDRHGFIAFGRDITRRKQAEVEIERARDEAQAASHAKSEFLAHMSHEIRTPLNGVMGMLDLILSNPLEERLHRYASLAKHSAETLTTLINDVLDVSKIEAGKLELAETDINLSGVVEDAVQMLAPRAANKKLELACYVAPDVPSGLRGDGDRVRQILVNLIGNAIKFTARGSVKLEVNFVETVEDRVVIRCSVADTGIGIPHDRLDRLFRSFSQVDATTTRQYGGTGLGLAICKKLVEMMGGSIGVESEVGRGSVFWFTLSFARPAAQANPEETASLPPVSRKQASDEDSVVPRRSSRGRRGGAPSLDARRLRVLGVDDDPVCRQVLQRQLESWRLRTQTVADGEAALAALVESAGNGAPFHVVIIDKDMPGMDGIELARRIKEHELLKSITLMILLALDTETSDQELHRLGIDGYMTKPVRQSQLFDAIMRAMARARRLETAEPVDSRERRESVPVHDGERLTPARVLVAEDNEVNLLVATEIMARAGFECGTAVNGQEAVNAFKDGDFDLILMDCQMPVMDGFDATRAIRAWEAERGIVPESPASIPIVALTANAVKGDRERCLESGMNDYVAKPLDPDRLLDIVDRFLARHRRDASHHGQTIVDTVSIVLNPADVEASSRRADASAPAIDLGAFRAQWGDDAAFARKLMGKFLSRAERNIETLTGSLERGDAPEVRRLAHGLRGAAGYVHARKVRALAFRLEQASENGLTADAPRILEDLRVEVEACRKLAEGMWTEESPPPAQPSNVKGSEAHAGSDR